MRKIKAHEVLVEKISNLLRCGFKDDHGLYFWERVIYTERENGGGNVLQWKGNEDGGIASEI